MVSERCSEFLDLGTSKTLDLEFKASLVYRVISSQGYKDKSYLQKNQVNKKRLDFEIRGAQLY